MDENNQRSTIAIKQRNGNPDKLSGNVRLSGTEFATILEGPMGKKTTFMASARRSYLQFLFQLLDLPIQPDYYDFQYKVNHTRKVLGGKIGVVFYDVTTLYFETDLSDDLRKTLFSKDGKHSQPHVIFGTFSER